MASTSSKIKFDLNDEENDTWSVYNCIFCKAQLDGNATILECLHIVCYNCMVLKKNTDSGIQCICQTVIKSQFTEYPIMSPSAKLNESCSKHNCSTIPKKKCICCNKFYCGPCYKEHLRNNNDNKTNLMMVYPVEFTQCTTCTEKRIEVYCDKCSIMMCAFCHLKLHKEHSFKILSTLVKEFKTTLSDKLCKLKQIDSSLSVYFEQSEKYTENVKINNKSIEEEIDMEMEKLREQVNERKLKIKNLVKKCCLDFVTTINKNIEFLNDLIVKNKYCIDLTEAMLIHNQKCEIMMLSKIVADKRKSDQKYETVITEVVLRFEVKMQLICDETLKECFSSIGAVGTCKLDITSSPLILDLSKIDCEKPSNNDSQTFENIQSANSSHKTNVDAGSQLLVECICCKQRDETLFKCDYCDRHFHNDCHIPVLLKINLQKKWKCTMCRDITQYSNEILSQHKCNTADNVPIHKTELKIMERILLELYCQNIGDNRTRESLIKGFYPNYYEKIIDSTSLNSVKKSLESKKYTSVFNFLKDLKQIFVNALLYYSPGEPHYVTAFEFQTTLNTMITKWLPTFDKSKLPYENIN